MNTKFEIQKAPRAFRTISEVAGEIGLEPYVIRFWESQFKQIRPMRRKGGRRYYRPADIEFLKGLKALLHGENLTIKKVKETIIKKGKKFIVGWPNEQIAKPSSRIEKRKVQIKLSYAGEKTIYINSFPSQEEKLKINTLLESFSELKKQLLARTNF